MSVPNKAQQTSDLFQKLRNGDRVALSRAITLIESQQPDHAADARALIDACLSIKASAMRLAISGAPGVGKSTFIEAISQHILKEGLSLSVLAIDPSSQITGGSLLGDKTRMQTLANHPNAYIRPSPAGSHVGGVADRTREAVLLCEAAGYDVIIVETVGVGQSEIQARTMVDLLTLLIAPGGGDEVQGIKRGILEVADLVIINKADGEMQKRAMETLGQYTQALRVLYAQDEVPPVVLCSALEGSNLDKVWEMLKKRFSELKESNVLTSMRDAQQITWFEYRLQQDLLQRWKNHPMISQLVEKYKHMIAAHEISAQSALAEMQLQHELLLKGN